MPPAPNRATTSYGPKVWPIKQLSDASYRAAIVPDNLAVLQSLRAAAFTPTLRAFLADANPSERRRFVREVKRFLDRTSGLDDEALSALVARLGSRWAPPSREALIAVLVHVTKPHA